MAFTRIPPNLPCNLVYTRPSHSPAWRKAPLKVPTCIALFGFVSSGSISSFNPSSFVLALCLGSRVWSLCCRLLIRPSSCPSIEPAIPAQGAPRECPSQPRRARRIDRSRRVESAACEVVIDRTSGPPRPRHPCAVRDRVKGAAPLHRGATRSALDTVSQRAIIGRRGAPGICFL